MTARPYPNITTAITPAESDLLARTTAGLTVLEIGSAWGYSTVWMALHGATVTAVDHHKDLGTWDVFRANLKRYGVQSRVQTILASSQEALPVLIGEGRLFDCVFIDADHGYLGASFDLANACYLVKPGGCIAAHDYTDGWPGVKRAVQEQLLGLPARLAGTLYVASVPADYIPPRTPTRFRILKVQPTGWLPSPSP